MVGSRQGIARHRRPRGRVSGHSSPGAPEAPEGSQAAPVLDGAEGNERLTAMTGAVLLIGLAIECYTILRIGRLLTLHVFLGMLLLGPVVLKAGIGPLPFRPLLHGERAVPAQGAARAAAAGDRADHPAAHGLRFRLRHHARRHRP